MGAALKGSPSVAARAARLRGVLRPAPTKAKIRAALTTKSASARRVEKRGARRRARPLQPQGWR